MLKLVVDEYVVSETMTEQGSFLALVPSRSEISYVSMALSFVEYDSAFSEDEKKQAKRAQAYIQLVDLDLAEMDIKKALEIDPYNRK
ncbi:Peptidyl-prolyl cis-trans isomerase, FKBP-type [Artemisia annua]|uniref:Peptidyl-prolyl cis-trans isomerase, FKBP-type n=1 Tax=Artemisia annua TaxID=35608 RepID=A0A2U1L6H9_ARTAN|nr:Peptidyl-prolyl cis-trans isomerase, FKBP-type [Artemisia annua]